MPLLASVANKVVYIEWRPYTQHIIQYTRRFQKVESSLACVIARLCTVTLVRCVKMSVWDTFSEDGRSCCKNIFLSASLTLDQDVWRRADQGCGSHENLLRVLGTTPTTFILLSHISLSKYFPNCMNGNSPKHWYLQG